MATRRGFQPGGKPAVTTQVGVTRARARPANPDPILELQWLAAWLEGEGHFRFTSTPQLRGYTTDVDVARRAWQILVTLFGAASLRAITRRDAPRKRCYEVGAYGPTAALALLAL